MKTFIFLLILIVAFYYVIFTQKEDGTPAAPTERKSLPAPTLEAIETVDRADLPPTDAEEPQREHAVSVAADSPLSGQHSLPAIEEDMTFLQLKSIIHAINPRYPQQRITLDSPISSLLPTQAARERFAREISAQFAISENDVRTALAKKRLLWDWVNLFRE